MISQRSVARKWLPPPGKNAAPCTQYAVFRPELAETQEPVLALGHPCLPCHDCPASAEVQPGPRGVKKKKASSKLLPVPGSHVENQAGKCSLQALGWAVEKQLRIGGCRAKRGFPCGQLVKNLPAMWEAWVQSLGWEDPLEKGKATHSRAEREDTIWHLTPKSSSSS